MGFYVSFYVMWCGVFLVGFGLVFFVVCVVCGVWGFFICF